MKFRNKKESTIVEIETLDDLWYLKNILEEGDEIIGIDYRRIKDETKLRADKGERVKVKLRVELEKAELSESKNALRLLGRIKEASREEITIGSYHAFDISAGDKIEIAKKEGFKAWQIELLKDAVKSSRAGKILFLAVEDSDAEFAILRAHGIDYVLRIVKSLGSKHVDLKSYDRAYSEFISQVAEKAFEICSREGIKNIVILGPGFAKEKVADELKKIIKEKKPDISLLVKSAGSGGRTGITEILKKGVADKVIENSRVSYESKVIEELLREIARDSRKAVYGAKEVEKAINLGAVEKLLILDIFLREDKRADELIKKARKIKAEVLIISSMHEAGEKLKAIGKIAALLRYAISWRER